MASSMSANDESSHTAAHAGLLAAGDHRRRGPERHAEDADPVLRHALRRRASPTRRARRGTPRCRPRTAGPRRRSRRGRAGRSAAPRTRGVAACPAAIRTFSSRRQLLSAVDQDHRRPGRGPAGDPPPAQREAGDAAGRGNGTSTSCGAGIAYGAVSASSRPDGAELLGRVRGVVGVALAGGRRERVVDGVARGHVGDHEERAEQHEREHQRPRHSQAPALVAIRPDAHVAHLRARGPPTGTRYAVHRRTD